MFLRSAMRQTESANSLLAAFVLFCICAAIAWSPPAAALFNCAPTRGQWTSVEILTPTEGLDFKPYIARLLKSVKHNWYAIMPDSARNGEKGRVTVRFHIQQDGSILAQEPKIETASGKGPLDRAAVGAIRGSAPFEHLPAGFHGPNIELRFIFLYNLPQEPSKL